MGFVRGGAQSSQPLAYLEPQYDHKDLLPTPDPASVLGARRSCGFCHCIRILVVLMFYYHVTPAWSLLWDLPLFLLLAIVTALGVALWLSAINVQYRDVNYALPFLTQFWLFATPVVYVFSGYF